MSTLLALPAELLLLVLQQLPLKDMLHFCATNREVRSTFKPDLLPAILEPCDHWTRVRALSEISHLLLCHALCELYRRGAALKWLEILVRQGASFGYVSNVQLVSESVLALGPGKRLDFLWQHGGSLEQLPGMAGELLATAVRVKGARSPTVTMLLRLGAQLSGYGDGLHDYAANQLLETVHIGVSPQVMFLLEHGADLHKSTGGINHVLERYFRWHRWDSETFDFLVGLGADIRQVPCGLNQLLQDTIYNDGDCPAAQYLISMGAEIDADVFYPKLVEEFKKDGYKWHARNMIDFPGVLLMKVPGGIDALLAHELFHRGLTESALLLLDKGALLRNVPDIDDHIDILLKNLSRIEPENQPDFAALIMHFRGWEEGAVALQHYAEDLYSELGPTRRVLRLLSEDWIPRSEAMNAVASYSLDSLFLDA